MCSVHVYVYKCTYSVPMGIDIQEDTNPPYLFICFPFAASTIYYIRLSTVVL